MMTNLISLTSIISFVIYLMSNIRSVCSSINLKTLPFYHDSTIYFSNYSGFYLHIDISSMKYQEQGIITLKFPDKRIQDNNILRVFLSKIVETKENIIFSFPVKAEESMFKYEKSFEKRYNHNFESVYHLYFNKTFDEIANIHLLIELMFGEDLLEQYKSESFFVSRISQIEDITVPPHYYKHFHKEIIPYVPVYFQFSLREKQIGDNVVFYCKDNIMTVHYDGLLKTNKINNQKLFHQIAGSDQYYLTMEGNQHSTFILKFLTDIDIPSLDFEVFYIRNPLIILKSILHSITYPIEINKPKQSVFFVGIHNRTTSVMNTYYLHCETIYGQSIVQYSSEFNMNFLLQTEQTFPVVTNVLKMESEVNFITVRCSSPCRLNIVLFSYQKLHEIYQSGIYFLILQRKFSYKQMIEITSETDFIIEIESLGLDKIDISYNGNKQYLDQYNNIMKYEIKIGSLRDERVAFTFQCQSECYVRILIQQKFKYSIVPLGISEYGMETIIFKFENNSNIESYEIELTTKNHPDLFNYYYNYYGFGDYNLMPFPSFKSLSVNQNRVLKFSNPYNKINQKMKETGLNYYYFVMKPFDDNVYSLTVNYYYIYQDTSLYLEQNTPLLIHSNNSNGTHLKKILTSNRYPNQNLVMQFFKCFNDFQYHLLFDSNILNTNIIMLNRTQIHLDNYFVDYTIEFSGYINLQNNYSFIFSYSYYDKDAYSYCDKDTFSYFFENTNYTIRYTLKGSSIILHWNTYLSSKKHQVYKIYINEYNNEDSHCSFINSRPFDILYYPDTINEKQLNYTFHKLKKGKYRVNVLAQENQTYHFTQIYDEVILEIKTNNSIRNILIFISVILGISSFYLKYVIHKTSLKKRAK